MQSALRLIPSRLFYLFAALIIFLYLFFVVEPHLVYYNLQPFFSFDPSYFDYLKTENLGELTILSNFILQFLHFPIFGTILLTLLLLALVFLNSYIIKIEKVRGLRGIEMIPSLVFLSFFNEYNTGLQSLIILFVAFILLMANRQIPQRLSIVKLIFHALAILFVFYIFDIITAFTVGLFLVIDEILFLKTKGRFLLIFWDIIIVFLLGVFLLGSNLIPLFMQQTFPGERFSLLPQFWPLLISHIAVMLLCKIVSIANTFKLQSRIPRVVRNNILLIILISLTIPFGKKYFVNPNKYTSEIGYFDSVGEWDEVLSLKSKVGLNDRIPRFLLNRALCRSGRMPDHLFLIPQEWGVNTLILTMDHNRECSIHSSDLFFDMRFIKGAEYWALEALTYAPYSPRVLNRLVQCNILFNNKLVAHKYLSVLKQSPIYSKVSKNLIKKLKEENTEDLKKEWMGKGKINTSNLYISNPNPSADLIKLLDEDPHNKIAYEYLMSFYLLKNKLGNFMYFLPNLKDFNYQSVPKIYEEALLFYNIFQNSGGEKSIFPVSKKTKEQLMKFSKTLIEYQSNEKKARADLYKNFGQTYWFYIRYTSPETIGGGLKIKGS